MVLDNINLPEDINSIIIYVDLVIFLAILTYSYVATDNSIIPKPLFFIYATIGSIFMSLIFKAYQKHIRLNFEKEHTHIFLNGEREAIYTREGYKIKVNNIYGINIMFSFGIYLIAIVVQVF